MKQPLPCFLPYDIMSFSKVNRFIGRVGNNSRISKTNVTLRLKLFHCFLRING